MINKDIKDIRDSKFKNLFEDIKTKYFSPISISPKFSEKLATLISSSKLNVDNNKSGSKETNKSNDTLLCNKNYICTEIIDYSNKKLELKPNLFYFLFSYNFIYFWFSKNY